MERDACFQIIVLRNVKCICFKFIWQIIHLEVERIPEK